MPIKAREHGMAMNRNEAGAKAVLIERLTKHRLHSGCRAAPVVVPNSKHRALVTPAKRGRGAQRATTADAEEPTPAERRAAMSLKRSA